MKEILIALMIWIGANTNYNINAPLPSIEFKTQVEMEGLYYQQREKEGELYGFYNLKKNIIILFNKKNLTLITCSTVFDSVGSSIKSQLTVPIT